jgi:nicotinate phosphoribosyltransferase
MGIIKSLLDTDVYKFFMQQAVFHQYPNKKVKYQFICRNKGVDFSPYLSEINQEIQSLSSLRFNKEEITYLSKIKKNKLIFKPDYLQWLRSFTVNPQDVRSFINPNGEFSIEVEGDWAHIIHWEIYCLSIVNEVYFRNTQPNADIEEGRRRLKEKIELVKEINSNEVEFMFSEFGTRRRFTREWQEEVCLTLQKELSGKGFLGSSNVHLSMLMGMDPVGTQAHEWFQAHQVLGVKKGEDSYFTSQENALYSWIKEYDTDLLLALSDIYGTDAFLSIFNQDLSEKFSGLRQDSGNPIEWVDKVINHYKKLGIDPKTKTVIFSDGLDFIKAKDILMYVRGKINCFFGIGTCITNDFPFKALNIVMKMIECEGKPVVKISDESSKGIGEKTVRDRIQEYFDLKNKNVSKKEILIQAHSVIGSDIKIKEWLSKKNIFLGNQSPRDLWIKDPARVLSGLLHQGGK